MNRFTLPRDLYYGRGSIEVLKTLKGKKAMVVAGDTSVKRFGFLKKVENYLKEAGMEIEIIDGIEQDPSVETVVKGARLMLEFCPDWIVSIGGESPIEAAKAMWVFYEHPETRFEDIAIPFNIPKLRNKARFVAIPSTGETASEVTSFSVITDYNEGIKYPLADFEITADIAIMDSDIAYEIPANLTAYTGIDALTHATEAITASQASDFSDPVAFNAIKLIKGNLEASYNGEEEARDKMHIAQCLVGMPFSNALLGISHSMAHKTGAVFGIPHGCANGIYLPYVIQYNRKYAESKYAKIARYIGLEGADDNELCNAYINYIRDLNYSLDIPASLHEYGVEETSFNKNLDRISENAALDTCTYSNSRETKAEDFKQIFTAAYYGKTITF